MPTFYLDYENGSDAADGSSWANAWKTITSGATAARIAPGDVVRIAKSSDPTSIGSATWTNTTKTGGGLDAAKSMGSSTNASPIEVTINAHGFATGDVVWIKGHTTNTAANGVWIITYVGANTFTLDGSTGNGVGGATGTCQRVTNACVVLGTAVNQTIENCQANWTAGTNVTSANIDTSVYKQDSASIKVICGASAGSNQIIAKYGLPASLDLSGYRQVSFWLRNETSAISSGDLLLKLYSDAACTSEVESLTIPAIPSTARWVPITINKGSALSATVQGVALYSVTAQPSKTHYIDNIIACKDATAADSLCLQSIISKTSAAQGGEWFAIQSIYGKIIVLESQPNALAFTHRGYIGTSEPVTTYKRNTIKTTMGTAASTVIQEVQDSGTLAGGYIEFSGGWDTGSTTQNGETFFDGLNGLGRGVQLSAKQYIKVDRISTFRYDNGFYLANALNNTFTTITAANSNTTNGINITSSSNNTFTTITAANSNGSNAMTLDSSNNNLFSSITSLNSGNTYGINLNGSNNNIFEYIGSVSGFSFYGIYIQSSSNNTFEEIASVKLNNNYGMYITAGNNNTFTTLTSSLNTISAINVANGYTRVVKATLSESSEFTGSDYQNSRLSIDEIDGTDYSIIYSDNAYIISQAATLAAGGKEWKMFITNSKRASNYPMHLPIARIACNASAQVTVTAYFKKSHATDIAANLICKGGQIDGVTEQVATCPSDTNTNELTITFTPTESGVVEILAQAWWVANTADENVIVKIKSITQA